LIHGEPNLRTHSALILLGVMIGLLIRRGALQGTMRMELDLLETVTGGGAMIGSPGEGTMTKPIWYTPR